MMMTNRHYYRVGSPVVYDAENLTLFDWLGNAAVPKIREFRPDSETR